MIYTQKLYFIYDGECPICQLGASTYRLRQLVGGFETIDARTETDHPVIIESNQKGFDLDLGMVIKYQGQFYQGDDALHLMAQLGADDGVLNIINNKLYQYKPVARFFYPFIKGFRNILLKIKGVKKIKNLEKFSRHQPIFQNIFGGKWDKLPLVFKKHYANKPFCNDQVTVSGYLDVWSAKFLKPLLSIFGAMPSKNQKNVPTKVTFNSQKENARFYFNRIFHYENQLPYYFKSYMQHISGNEIAETMSWGLTWHATFDFDGEYVQMKHTKYSWKIFGAYIWLPITWLVGSGNAKEWALSEDEFEMQMDMSHPLFGKIYEYKGKFTVTGINV